MMQFYSGPLMHFLSGVDTSLQFTRVIPEIDIWPAANLMLKRYGEKAFEESSTRADVLAADGAHDGASTWRRITVAVKQVANNLYYRPAYFTDRNGTERSSHLPRHYSSKQILSEIGVDECSWTKLPAHFDLA